jgi:hypothetical protein
VKIVRPTVALALAASLAASGAASAATKAKPKRKPAPPKPVCNLITDPAGDASLQPPVPSDDSLDVLSGDLASNAKNVTAVLRLKDLGATSPTQITGRNYYLLFSLPKADNPVYFSYEDAGPVLGASFSWGDLEPGAGGVGTYTKKGDATGTVDTAKNEIRITVPVADVRDLASIAPGVKVTNLHVSTTAVVGVLVFDVDSAAAAKSYVAGYPSCVKPGV